MTIATVHRIVNAASLFAVLFAFPAVPQIAQSQPSLNFKRVINNWPTIELYFSSACEGRPAYFSDKRYFAVMENGVAVADFDLWCPDTLMRCAISVSLVLDASSAMYGAGNAGVKTAANAFVDLMDGVVDEAAVIWFSSIVWTSQPMTIDRPLLHDAINSLPAMGSSSVWDGIYQGVLELINSGVNQCRAVIAITGGWDNNSSRGVSEITALANRNRVRVFTIGMGSSVNQLELQSIATLTGGRYYQAPDTAQLAAVYTEISTFILQGSQECLITYNATCMDGGMRTVDLSLLNFCSGSDTKTKTYKALRDSSTFVPLRFGLGAAQARGDTTATLPLAVLDAIPAATMLHPATFTVLFDSSRATWLGYTIPPGSLLDGVPTTSARVPGGVRFETVDKKFLPAAQSPGTMMELAFCASDPHATDTVRCPLHLADWTFSAGCIKPVPMDGEMTFVPPLTSAGALPSAPSLLELFPDPASGALTLRIPSHAGEAVRVTVHDLLGRTLLDREETSASDLYQCAFSLLPAPPGTYVVSITSGARRWTRTIRLY